MDEVRKSELWMEGFAKQAAEAGIEDPDAVMQLVTVARRKDLADRYPEQFKVGEAEVMDKVSAMGGWGHVGTGAAGGAAIGSAVPVLGTALGGLIGGGIGGLSYLARGGRRGADKRNFQQAGKSHQRIMQQRQEMDRAMAGTGTGRAGGYGRPPMFNMPRRWTPAPYGRY